MIVIVIVLIVTVVILAVVIVTQVILTVVIVTVIIVIVVIVTVVLVSVVKVTNCCIKRERSPVSRNCQIYQVVRDLFLFGPIGFLAFFPQSVISIKNRPSRKKPKAVKDWPKTLQTTKQTNKIIQVIL